MTRRYRLAALCLALGAAGCGKAEPGSGGSTAPPAAPAVAAHDMAAMHASAGADAARREGMDHGAMAMSHDSAAAGGGATGSVSGMHHAGHAAPAAGAHARMAHAAGGMDHGAAAGGAGMRHGAGHAAGRMDHAAAGMDHGAAAGGAGMRHGAGHAAAGHSPASRGQPGAGHMAGMDHGAHPAAEASGNPRSDRADERLLRITAGLVRDPVVQARIQADPRLRARWQDPAVRRALESPAP